MHFEIYTAKNGQYAWRLRAGNGKIVADGGETYKRKADCEGALELFRQLAPTAPVNDRVENPDRGRVGTGAEFELYRSEKDGDYYWRFQQGGNNEILADGSEGYSSKAGCEAAIERVKRLVPKARVDDETDGSSGGGFTPREEPTTVGGGRFS
jgi:uncharacterized protein YegP (UPF0339 family)